MAPIFLHFVDIKYETTKPYFFEIQTERSMSMFIRVVFFNKNRYFLSKSLGLKQWKIKFNSFSVLINSIIRNLDAANNKE